MTFSRLSIKCCELTTLDAFDLNGDPSTRVSLFRVDEEMSSYFFTREVKILVEVDGIVHIRPAVAHHLILI